MRDDLYTRNPADPASFVFDADVARVFPDMISRSVPGYAATLKLIGSIADRYTVEGAHCYDLGCSLGDGALSVQRHVGDRVPITAVDSSPAMIEALQKRLADAGSTSIHPVLADVRDIDVQNTGLTLLNFTLQFIPKKDRTPLLSRIAAGTRPGGVLVLSEKIAFDDPFVQHEMEKLHEAFKKSNGYSDLEISRKRTALENVLIPETLETHRNRLRAAGFSRVQVWLQCFNFISLLAFRE